MAQIKIQKGLDIPIMGSPSGSTQVIISSGEASPRIAEKQYALDLSSFPLRFHLLAKVGDHVRIGQPIAEDKQVAGRYFLSPASGVINDVQRGLKRAVQYIVIDNDFKDEYEKIERIDPSSSSQEELINFLKRAGLFAKIRMRPFDLLAYPNKLPKAIFVKAIESAPFIPPAEMQVAGFEKEFQAGLKLLKQLCPALHVVVKEGSSLLQLIPQGVTSHTAEGPHPISNPSVHIERIDPIRSLEDIRWTLTAHDVTCIGHILLHEKMRHDRVIGIGGPAILSGRTGYFKVREGVPIHHLISGRLEKEDLRLISGDPLMGKKVANNGFLGYSDFALSAVPDPYRREFLHFMRFGTEKYSFSRAYLSGHLNNKDRKYFFTTSQHGEHRPFIDSSLYDKVQPLKIPTMLLVKAIMAEDYEAAEKLGLYEVAPEDFALPTFVCPSKMEMVEIVRNGLQRYAQDVLI